MSLRLLGYALTERMRVLPQYNAAYMFFTMADLDSFQYQSGDLSNVVNYPLSIEGIQFVALFKEHPNEIRISFRSKGDFSVNEFARLHFGGGGHKNAAGGKSYDKLMTTLRKFTETLEQYKDQLTSD